MTVSKIDDLSVLPVLVSSTECNLRFGLLGALISFVFFVINTRYLLPALSPWDDKESFQKRWKWRNTANSLVHSFITGIGAFLNLWFTPDLRVNLLTATTSGSLLINSVTVGYFIYDFIDLVANNLKKKNTTELLLHHVLVTICFGLSLVTCRYQGWAMVSLLLEVNSIFLHIRQLLILHDIPKNTGLYRAISYLNIGTLVVFRVMTICWQLHWLCVHRNEAPLAAVILGFITLTAVMILSLGLLVQIIQKDFTMKFVRSKEN